MTTDYTGGCSCGSVKYTLLDDPIFTHCCHCHLCQQITGSAFITNTSRIQLASAIGGLIPNNT